MIPFQKERKTMNNTFNELVSSLEACHISIDTIQQLNLIFKQQTDESLSSFINQSYESLLIVERWMWKLLSENDRQRLEEYSYVELFHNVAIFNKKLIFNNDDIDATHKTTLLFCVTVDQIKSICRQIDETNDQNDLFITFVSLWLDNYSYFLYENPQHNVPSVVDHIDQYIIHNCIMNETHKFYLTQLRQLHLSESMFTSKLLFYLKTCTFYTYTYKIRKLSSFPYTADQMISFLYDDYLEIIRFHSHTVKSWNKNLLGCIAQLTGLLSECFWWDGKQRTHLKIIFPTEQITCNHIEDLIRIIAHKQFYGQTKSIRSNDETTLIDSILMILLTIVQSQNVNWFFRSNTTVRDTIVSVAELALNDEVCLCGYCILGETLSEDQLKDLKIADNINDYFFQIMEEAWKCVSKVFRQIPLEYMLKGFQILSKNDSIQERTAYSNKLILIIDMSDQYPIVFDIIWALSFNHDIQQQLLSNSTFIEKLSHLSKQSDDEQIRKATTGILWNLQINQQHHPNNDDISPKDTFDFMISYSHKDKVLCKQLYDELIRRNYRVWIDFDQMHGNVMDAMAQAIDRSQTIIICMSEQYRKSNFCRAEAHYAFQRQRQIVPVLMQKHYKPDGWLLFLIGQLLYVDFTKYDFDRAMEMLMKELRANDNHETNTAPIQSTVNIHIEEARTTGTSSSRKISAWSQFQVQQWLTEHRLVQILRLLDGCDGRSLVYLHSYIKAGDTQQILSLLQQDSLRLTNQNISLIELCRFRSMMDEHSGPSE
ncbi:hypothetical protein I4U23_025703 [Adineta vaga]|nr:hypothetical protein I4U23_025703 [Adineta vaga]